MHAGHKFHVTSELVMKGLSDVLVYQLIGPQARVMLCAINPSIP